MTAYICQTPPFRGIGSAWGICILRAQVPIEQLRYSCRVGATHHDDLVTNELSQKSALPGVEPIFFFAPTQLKKRINDWGTAKTMSKIFLSLHDYIEFCRTIMSVKHSTGEQAIQTIYQQVLSGKADASVGQVISL